MIKSIFKFMLPGKLFHSARPALFYLCLLIFAGQLLQINLNAQQTDTVKGKNIYRPSWQRTEDTIRGVTAPEKEIQRNRDSLEMRMLFVRDSLLAREQFVKDSILRRERMLDSVTFLKNELQSMLEAYFGSLKEEIIIRYSKIPVVGDTALGDFNYLLLPFGAMDPYTPWKGKAVLCGKNIRFSFDKSGKKIVEIRTPQVKASFRHHSDGKMLVIEEPAVIQNNSLGRFYKKPIDTVYFDPYRRITRIKKYLQFFTLINGNQCGQLLFTNRTQVKQYKYGTGNEMNQYQIVRFCERWKVYEPNKVCSILNYSFTKEGSTYTVDRRNDPANKYSDGTYTFVLDNPDNLKSIAFQNMAKTENWKREIEINKEGYVSCYIDKTNDIVRQSLCMIYHKEANARYPVETITTSFEKDGISYFQRNNTTEMIRTRDKMTLEWTPWRLP